jgi:hypothetical protein
MSALRLAWRLRLRGSGLVQNNAGGNKLRIEEILRKKKAKSERS